MKRLHTEGYKENESNTVSKEAAWVSGRKSSVVYSSTLLKMLHECVHFAQ